MKIKMNFFYTSFLSLEILFRFTHLYEKEFYTSIWIVCFAVLATVYFFSDFKVNSETNESKSEKLWSSKKTKVKAGEKAYQSPDGFIKYFQQTSKRIGETESKYKNGYKALELQDAKAKSRAARAAKAPFDAIFTSRGPGNVGGRTRAIAIDPDDATHCTWVAGAASGGIWKTTDCGVTWSNVSEGLPNLSTNSIAQAASNPDIIYVGTGEVFAGNSSFVRGDGIYKSIDRGVNWTLLPSTVDNTDYTSVNRIAIDPTDADIVVIVTNSGIYRSTDGGNAWTETFDAPLGGSVQDLQVDPNDFNVQYAGVNSNGIYKSTDAGVTWLNSSVGISEGIRFEIAVAPSNTNIVYTSTFSGDNTILYYSADFGATWFRVEDPDFNTNFLYSQGWYDNTIEVNPYNPYEVFVGGVSIGKFNVDINDLTTSRGFLGVENGTSFLELYTYNAGFNGGTLDIAEGDLSPSDNPVSVEIRWGNTKSQMAHRFSVPSNGGTNGDGGGGIPVTNWTYEDYIEVPFEVWDVENDRQLMVSFRDQANDGEFNLNPWDEENDPSLLTSREYIYIHDLEYNGTTPNSEVSSTAGGVTYANMYFFWPILDDEATWDPDNYVDQTLAINYGDISAFGSEAEIVADARNDYGGLNNNVHADHHHLTFIKTDEANEEFMIINGNDGAFTLSTNNGATFVTRESGYVTSQFYGADKKPGDDRYIGGMQDNGTYVSTGTDCRCYQQL